MIDSLNIFNRDMNGVMVLDSLNSVVRVQVLVERELEHRSTSLPD
jgi:hypothetical protein